MRAMVLIVFLSLGLASESHAASLLGTPSSAIKQNIIADGHKLLRLSEVQLTRFKKNGQLVQLINTSLVYVDPRMPVKYQWCLRDTHAFIFEFASAYHQKFGRRLQINSAVRTIEYQVALGRHNKNAAPVVGPKTSTHLTGATIDIAKKGLPDSHLAWMREELLKHEEAGRIDGTEEMMQAVFHVMVYPTTIQVPAPTPVLVASTRAD